jgi:cytochrome c-type biogenesis protein CcmH
VNSYIFIPSIVIIGLLSFGIYSFLGSPNLPAQALATREIPVAPKISIEDAVVKVEEQLKKDPNDVRAWSVVAPVYMQQGRFDEAVKAYKKIVELTPNSADTKTDLAVALIMQNQNEVSDEAIELLKASVKFDPKNTRSLFFLSSELTRAGQYQDAAKNWQDLLALSVGDENWKQAAIAGLSEAEAGLNGEPVEAEVSNQIVDEEEKILILDMVKALSLRLKQDGGSVEEWTRLVRSYLVLEDNEQAQLVYNEAKSAYPDKNERKMLDALADEAGLK